MGSTKVTHKHGSLSVLILSLQRNGKTIAVIRQNIGPSTNHVTWHSTCKGGQDGELDDPNFSAPPTEPNGCPFYVIQAFFLLDTASTAAAKNWFLLRQGRADARDTTLLGTWLAATTIAKWNRCASGALPEPANCHQPVALNRCNLSPFIEMEAPRRIRVHSESESKPDAPFWLRTREKDIHDLSWRQSWS